MFYVRKVCEISSKMMNKCRRYEHFHIVQCQKEARERAARAADRGTSLSLEFRHFRRYIHQKTLTCWQCGVERDDFMELFCEKCHHLQKPFETENYFHVLDVDQKYDVDPKNVTNSYRRLQTILHPDKFANKSEAEKSVSEEYSSLVNKAYETLQSPMKRAIHMLALKGQKFDETQKIQDPEFLMEIMELNEEVENAQSDDTLRALLKKNQTELKKIMEDLAKAFDDGNLAKAKAAAVKMKYYFSVNTNINKIMRDKGVVD